MTTQVTKQIKAQMDLRWKLFRRHMAGSNNCEVRLKERVSKRSKLIADWVDEELIKIWHEGKDESPRSNPQTYLTHFRCIIYPKNKENQPVGNRKEPHPKSGSKPATIRSNNKSEIVIEILNEKESEILPTIKSICSPPFQKRVEVEIFACDKFNQRKGVIYI